MLRNRLRNLGGEAMRLPRPDRSGLAMTKSGGPDKPGNYKNLGGRGLKCGCPIYWVIVLRWNRSNYKIEREIEIMVNCKNNYDFPSLSGRELEGGGNPAEFTLTFPDLIGTPVEGEEFIRNCAEGYIWPIV